MDEADDNDEKKASEKAANGKNKNEPLKPQVNYDAAERVLEPELLRQLDGQSVLLESRRLAYARLKYRNLVLVIRRKPFCGQQARKL